MDKKIFLVNKKYYIIEIKKIINNINVIKSKVNVPIIAVIKCDAYGLGLIELAKILINNKIKYFAVTDISDIIKLRNNFNNQNIEILFLNQTNVSNEIEVLIKKNVILTVGSLESALSANKLAVKMNIKINAYIKIDIGMGRYGFRLKDISMLKKTINENKNINFIGIYSHFSSAFSKNNITLKAQINYLNNFINILKYNNILINNIIVANSFISLNIPSLHFSGVRIGSAFLGKTICNNQLEKVGYLKTFIHEIKEIDKGQTIGYGSIYVAKSKMKIAILSLGYYDGFSIIKDNIFPNTICFLIYQIMKIIKNFIFQKKYSVYISKQKYSIIGKIGMCHSMIDITNSNVTINDDVIVEISPLRINPNIQKIYV